MNAASPAPINEINEHMIPDQDNHDERDEELLVDESQNSHPQLSDDVLQEDLDLNPALASENSQDQSSEPKEAPVLPQYESGYKSYNQAYFSNPNVVLDSGEDNIRYQYKSKSKLSEITEDEQLSAFELPSDDDGRKYQEEKPVEDVDPG